MFDEALAEAGSDVYLLVRASDLYPIYISGNFERVFHLPPSRIEDDIEALYRLLPDDDRRRVRSAVAAWQSSEPLVLEFSFTPDGSAEARKTRCTTTPVRGGAQYLVEFDDVSQEEGRVELLEHQVRSLSSDARIKADFLNQMSHEIRTPLNGIIGMLSLARDHCDDRSELLDDLGKVDELGQYLLSLVNDILDMSRIESGKVELEQKPFGLASFAQELHAMFEGNALERGVTYTVELQGCKDRFLVGDRMRLSQVVVNLVSNALKFTPAGGTVSVTFKEMYRTEDTVRLMARVRDTGKGMDPQFLGRIFRPFEQEDASIAQQYGGSGLGMAIADSLVSLMGGEIVVDSEVGKGTEFALYLPFGIAESEPLEGELATDSPDLKFACVPVAPAKASEMKRPIAAPVAQEGGQPSIFAGLRVLMAEDNDVNAKITSAVLAKRGAVVERARDGQEAVDLFEQHERGYYDVVLMDIRMPVVDGWEAARRIRALETDAAPRVVLIALSANAYVEDARHSQEMGMDGHVGKPIDFDELEALLSRVRASRSSSTAPQNSHYKKGLA